jgi:hypothetical protein
VARWEKTHLTRATTALPSRLNIRKVHMPALESIVFGEIFTSRSFGSLPSPLHGLFCV